MVESYFILNDRIRSFLIRMKVGVKMYTIISFISLIIRQFYLPNPYVNFINSDYADIFNILVGGTILHFLAYGLTGIWYVSRTDPGIGSFGYLINYIILVIGFTVLGSLTANLTVLIVLVILFLILVLILNVRISQNNY